MHAFLALLDSLAKLQPWDFLALPKAQEPPGLVSLYFTTPALTAALPCEAPWGSLCILRVCPEGSVMFVDGLLEAIPSSGRVCGDHPPWPSFPQLPF